MDNRLPLGKIGGVRICAAKLGCLAVGVGRGSGAGEGSQNGRFFGCFGVQEVTDFGPDGLAHGDLHLLVGVGYRLGRVLEIVGLAPAMRGLREHQFQGRHQPSLFIAQGGLDGQA